MRNIDEQKSMDLGELYRELRIARGLKLKDVARDNLSISQLSKFENGQSMLSADRLLLAIEGIHMTFAEFGHALNDYWETDFLRLRHQIISRYGEQDIEGLRELLETYRDREAYDTYNHLNLLAIKDSLYSLDSAYEVDAEEIEFLTKYLYDVEEWTEYELFIFGSTMMLLSTEDLIFLGRAFVERDKLYRSLPGNALSAKTVLLNISSIMVEKREFYYAAYFMKVLEDMLTFMDTVFISSLTFLKLLMAYMQEEEGSYQKLEAYLEALALTGNTELADVYRAKLTVLGKGAREAS